MSLQVWLPLTKDLRQQGLSNIKVENHNATLNTAGKLGSCYYFNGSQQWLQFDTVLGDYYNNDWSIACWLKPTDSTRSVIISEYSSTGASNVGLELTASRVVRLYWNGSPDINFTTAGALPINEWTHLTVTKQARVVKVYFNGELKQTYTNSSDFSTRTSASYPRIGDDYRGNSSSTVSYQGYINDFRMYDHCLSPMEVKELAKGLVLHYPLNRQGWGQKNLLPNTSGAVRTYTYPSSSYQDKWVAQTIEIPSGSTYILSFEAKSTVNGDKVRAHYYNPNTTTTCVSNQGINKTASDGNIDFTLSTIWQKYWVIYSQSSTTAKKTVIFPRMGAVGNTIGVVSGTGTVSIRGVKLEEGNIATPWIPAETDTLYSTMGLNSTIEYDCSGFCNNGTRMGTFTWTSDTPKYAVSQVFNGTDNAIQTPNLTTMITDKNYTIACWTYKTVIGTKSYQTIYGGPGGFELEARSGSSTSPLYRIHNWGGGTTAYNFGEWTHFCFVHTDSDSKLYVNGELKITGSSANVPSGNYFIGAWNTSTSQNYEGNMSDFRIYATALSASDVKSLYQNSAYIDSSGNVYGAVHSEV